MTAVSSCGSKEAPAGANPLLSEWDTPYGVPPFDKIKVSDYMPAFREAMKLHREEIKAIAENPEEPDFENTVLAFDNAGEMLTRVEQVFWSVAAADTNPQMQAVQEKVAPMLSEHYDGIMLDEKLFDRIRKVYEGRDAAGLDRLQKRLVEKVYKDFVRSGANLTAEQKAEFKEINSRLSELTFRFGKNLLEENARFRMVLNEEDVEGLRRACAARPAMPPKRRDSATTDTFSISGNPACCLSSPIRRAATCVRSFIRLHREVRPR